MNARHIASTLLFSTLFTLVACEKDEDSGANAADACASFCSVFLACEGEEVGDQAECQMSCELEMQAAQDYSAACASAYESLNLCIGALTCPEYDDYWTEPTPAYPCADEDTALDTACNEF